MNNYKSLVVSDFSQIQNDILNFAAYTLGSSSMNDLIAATEFKLNHNPLEIGYGGIFPENFSERTTAFFNNIFSKYGPITSISLITLKKGGTVQTSIATNRVAQIQIPIMSNVNWTWYDYAGELIDKTDMPASPYLLPQVKSAVSPKLATAIEHYTLKDTAMIWRTNKLFSYINLSGSNAATLSISVTNESLLEEDLNSVTPLEI
jgi:hypothetical protein